MQYKMSLNSPDDMRRCALSNGSVTGFQVEHDKVTEETHETMLVNYAFHQFQSISEYLMLLRDDAPQHYFNLSSAYVNEKIRNSQIERDGEVFYLPRSPRLTPCDFFCRCISHLSYELPRWLLLRSGKENQNQN